MFEIPAGCDRARVGVDLHASSGRLLAHSIELRRLELSGRALAAYWLLVVLWLATMRRGLPLLLPGLRLDAAHVAAVGLLVALFVGVLVPRHVPRAAVRWARDVVAPVARPVGLEEPPVFAPTPLAEVRARPPVATSRPRSLDGMFVLQKLWHVVWFFAVTCALLATRPDRTRTVVVAAVVLAAATELLQMFTATRSAAWFDIGCDLAGAATALLVVGASRRLRSVRVWE